MDHIKRWCLTHLHHVISPTMEKCLMGSHVSMGGPNWLCRVEEVAWSGQSVPMCFLPGQQVCLGSEHACELVSFIAFKEPYR
jgi:hypothetical protein